MATPVLLLGQPSDTQIGRPEPDPHLPDPSGRGIGGFWGLPETRTFGELLIDLHISDEMIPMNQELTRVAPYSLERGLRDP